MLMEFYKAVMFADNQSASNSITEKTNVLYRVNDLNIVNHCKSSFTFRTKERLIFYRQCA